MLFKKGNDSFIQVIQAANTICHSLRVILANHSAPKKLLECMEQLNISLVLHNREFRQDLIPRGHLRMTTDADEEAAFSINKTHHPLSLQLRRIRLNVKSLRVLHLEPSLRIVPLSVRF